MTNETVMRGTRVVLRVGDGRGFVVDSRDSNGGPARIVITAAHCLPSNPQCFSAATLEEYTYRDLLGPLDASPRWERNACSPIRAPISRCWSSQIIKTGYKEAEAYNRLMKDMEALPVAAAPAQGRHGAGYVLTLDGKWKQGRLKRLGHTLGFEPERYIAPGMSGSPIVSEAGAAAY